MNSHNLSEQGRVTPEITKSLKSVPADEVADKGNGADTRHDVCGLEKEVGVDDDDDEDMPLRQKASWGKRKARFELSGDGVNASRGKCAAMGDRCQHPNMENARHKCWTCDKFVHFFCAKELEERGGEMECGKCSEKKVSVKKTASKKDHAKKTKQEPQAPIRATIVDLVSSDNSTVVTKMVDDQQRRMNSPTLGELGSVPVVEAANKKAGGADTAEKGVGVDGDYDDDGDGVPWAQLALGVKRKATLKQKPEKKQAAMKLPRDNGVASVGADEVRAGAVEIKTNVFSLDHAIGLQFHDFKHPHRYASPHHSLRDLWVSRDGSKMVFPKRAEGLMERIASSIIQSNPECKMRPIINAVRGNMYVMNAFVSQAEGPFQFATVMYNCLKMAKIADREVKDWAEVRKAFCDSGLATFSVDDASTTSVVASDDKVDQAHPTVPGKTQEEKVAYIMTQLKEPLTSREQQLLNDAVHSECHEDTPLLTYKQRNGNSKKYGILSPILKKDWKTLEPETWLNDEIINVYLYQMDWSSSGCGCFRSLFYTTLIGRDRNCDDCDDYNYDEVRSWPFVPKNANFWDCKKIFIPINEGNWHWLLVVVDLSKKKILGYDSDSGGGDCASFLQHVLHYLQDRHWKDHRRPLATEEWKLEGPDKHHCPQQTNGKNWSMVHPLLSAFDFTPRSRTLTPLYLLAPTTRLRLWRVCPDLYSLSDA